MQTFQLSIPSPCQEDWGNMQPNHQGRFCSACAKSVVDFTNMSDADLVAFFTKPTTGNVCGRAHSGQLERVLQAPMPPRKKIFQYWQYMLTLFLFFAKGNQAKAQGAIKMQTQLATKPIGQLSELLKGKLITNQHQQPAPAGLLMGDTIYSAPQAALQQKLRIVNEAGAAIPFASLLLMPGNKTVVADYDGCVPDQQLSQEQQLTVSAVGYLPVTIMCTDIKTNQVVLTLKPVEMEPVVVSSYSGTVGRIMAGGISRVLIHRTYKDSIQDFFARFSSALTIYPNPVQKAGRLTVRFNSQENQTYQLRVSATTGQVLLQQAFTATGKQADLPLQVPAHLSSGVYVIAVYDEKNRRIGTGKFILQ